MNEKMLLCVSTENKLLLCYCDITNVEIKIMCFIRNNKVKKQKNVQSIRARPETMERRTFPVRRIVACHQLRSETRLHRDVIIKYSKDRMFRSRTRKILDQVSGDADGTLFFFLSSYRGSFSEEKKRRNALPCFFALILRLDAIFSLNIATRFVIFSLMFNLERHLKSFCASSSLPHFIYA